jgi:nitrile hydratase accessory protein
MPPSTVAIHDLPALPRDEEGPVFNEPWEAHAFALAVRLSEAGCFTCSEWAAALSHAIQVAQEGGDPDLGHSYYHHWLNALERLCAEKELVSGTAMHRRKEQWRRAYLHTPHGQPIELCSELESNSSGSPTSG